MTVSMPTWFGPPIGEDTFTTYGIAAEGCPHCSGPGFVVYHNGAPCDKVKAIEYFPDGSIKRIEYYDQRNGPLVKEVS